MTNASHGRRVIGHRCLVTDLGVVRQGLVSVCETLRDVQRIVLISSQLDAKPTAIGGGLRSKINDYVVNGTHSTPNQFDFGVR
jgi:hypothetical protein